MNNDVRNWVMFGIVTAILIIGIAVTNVTIAKNSDNVDDAPDWAEEAVRGLKNGGGQIRIYTTSGNTSVSTYSYQILNLSASGIKDIWADSTGITIHTTGDMIHHLPYDRIASITCAM